MPPSAAHPPLLTLMIASRNDQYMGDPVWRLQTAVNYTATSAERSGRLEDLEILITDWGSEVPLRTVLRLNAAAARIVSFLEVPPAQATTLQRDSPFPEVLALNAVVRRARGTYIGRIDNDTLVHRRFFEQFLQLADSGHEIDGARLDSVLIFTNRHQIPYRFVQQRPTLWQVDWFIEKYGRRLLVQSGETFGQPFYYGATGIWLLHRSLWLKAGGYDESLIYWGWIEQDMIHRLRTQHPLVDWDRRYGCECYHLEHYDPRVRRVTERQGNVAPPAVIMNPNGPHWGLADLELPRIASTHTQQLAVAETFPPHRPGLRMLRLMLKVRLSEWLDTPYVLVRRSLAALNTLTNHPLRAWPTLFGRWLRILLR